MCNSWETMTRCMKPLGAGCTQPSAARAAVIPGLLARCLACREPDHAAPSLADLTYPLLRAMQAAMSSIPLPAARPGGCKQCFHHHMVNHGNKQVLQMVKLEPLCPCAGNINSNGAVDLLGGLGGLSLGGPSGSPSGGQQQPPPAQPAQDDFFGMGGGTPQAPAQPQLPVLLPADKGKGLTIAGRLARERGQIGMSTVHGC